MSCPHRAILIITSQFPGTASSIARQRIELRCRLAAGHDGPHQDTEHQETWTDRGSELSHLLRDEDEAASR